MTVSSIFACSKEKNMERFFLDFLMSTDYYPLLFFIHTPQRNSLNEKNSGITYTCRYYTI